MSTTQLKWVAVILAIAALGWFISERTSQRPDDRETGRVLPETVEGVDQVVFASPGGTIVLARDGAAWTVNDLDISNEQLATLFTALSDTMEYEVVARSAAVHGRMGVDDSGTLVTFFRGNQQVDQVVFGKRGSDQNSVFVRREGEDAVYRYGGPMADLVDLRLDDWRNKIIVDAMPEMIGRIDVSRPDGRFALERQATGWVLAPDTPADTAAVTRLLRNFRPLRATGFATQPQIDSLDFGRSGRRLTLVDTAGDTLIALAVDSLASRYFVRSHRSPTVFSLGPGQIERILPDEAGLRPAP
jgi:hypothetical protein